MRLLKKTTAPFAPAARLVPMTLVALLGLTPLSALAELTDSEKAQIRDFYAASKADDIARVRSLLARPDVEERERDAIAKATFARIRFDEKHARFTSLLLFGPASEASRSELLPAVVAGLLERSRVVLESPSAFSNANSRGALGEAIAIQRFVTETIAAEAFRDAQGSARIRVDALEAAGKHYASYFALPLFAAAKENPALRAVLLESRVAFLTLSSRAMRFNLAKSMNLSESERTVFEKHGLLVSTTGTLDEKTASKLGNVIELFSPFLLDAKALWLGGSYPADVTRSSQVLAATEQQTATDLWGSAIEPTEISPTVAHAAGILAKRSVEVALSKDAKFTERAKALASQASATRSVLPPSQRPPAEAEAPPQAGRRKKKNAPFTIGEAELFSSTLELLALDPERTIALSLIDFSEGRKEPVDQLSLALGLLAKFPGSETRPLSIAVGRQGKLTNIEISKAEGSIDQLTAFTVGKKRYEIRRAKDGSIQTVLSQGSPVSRKSIEFAKKI